MAGINISADLDAKSFLKGTKDMEKALEGVSDELETVAKDGDKGLEKLSDKLKEAKKTADAAGDGFKSGFGKDLKQVEKVGVDTAEEIKDEFKANLSEVVSSFDGSVESIVDLVQGTLGGLVSSLGPLGLAAGAAGALGVGLISAEITQAGVNAETAKQRVIDLGKAMIESGANGEMSTDAIIDNLLGIVTNSDDATKKFSQIAKEAKEAGKNAGALATAYAGGTEALKDQIDGYDKLITASQKAQNEAVQAGSRNIQNSTDQIEAYKDQRDALIKVQEETKAAADAEKAWLESGGNELVAKKGLIDAVDASYDALAGDVEYFTVKETGLFDTKAYVKAMQERELALKRYQESITTSGLSPEAIGYLNSLGTDAAAAMLQGYTKEGPDTKKELDRIWSEAAKTASGSVKTNLDGVLNEDRKAKITATVDSATAEADLNKITAAREAIIKVKYVDMFGRPVS